MADRPILFSGPMVRALLAGRKTQTRRIMKVQPPRQEDFPRSVMGINRAVADGVKMFSTNDYERLPKHPTKWDLDGSIGVFCDAGFPMEYDARFAIGDRLWVKETWAPLDSIIHNDPGSQACADNGFYRADNSTVEGEISKWRPSIFMPRVRSRLTLTVTDVRVERLNECSEEDAIAEGIEADGFGSLWGWIDYLETNPNHIRHFADPRRSYASLWDSINGAGAWEVNPWVVAVTFDVREGNIDG